MSLKPFALLLLAALVVVALVTGIGLWSMARALVAVPLVLLAPGYAVTSALFPPRRLGGAEILVFSLGISLALTALAGLLLNLTPWGLGTGSWLVFLAITIVGFGAVALRRRGGLAALAPLRTRKLPVPQVYAGALLACSALVLILGFRLAVTSAEGSQEPGFTQLWMVPVPVTGQQVHQVRLGVSNREQAATTYSARLTVQGRAIRTWPRIALAPGQTWQFTIALPSGLPGKGKVEVTLYRTTHPQTIYRRVWLQHDS